MILLSYTRGCRGCDHVVVGFTTTYVISNSIHHYVIKFVRDLRQVSDFLQVLWFPPPIKLTAMIELKYC
jgi:hypothetical protein